MHHIKLCEVCGGLLESEDENETKCQNCKDKSPLYLPMKKSTYTSLGSPLTKALDKLETYFVR